MTVMLRNSLEMRQIPLIRVTQLEKFRRFISGEYEYETEQGVIDSITQEFTGNEQTRIGTAFHSIVETGSPSCEKVPAGERSFLYYGKKATEPIPCGRRFNIDGFNVVLDMNQCQVALDYRNEYPNAYHEIRLYKDFGDAVVTGCADMIDGAEIRDIKTKYSYPSDADYINSCQWRFYLELFQADVFHFDLFIFDGYNKDKHGYDVRGLPLERYSPSITCYRYSAMEKDNAELLSSFLEWAKYRNLINKLIWQIK